MSELIAKKLIDIGSVQFSFNDHFTLTSGLKSPVYVDCRRIISFIVPVPRRSAACCKEEILAE